MFYSANGKSPQLSPTARIAQGARLVGQVQLMENSSVWYNAVLRADNAPITIGEGSNVQDNCTLHTDPNYPITVGKGVSIGHGAILHGCTVGDHCTIGMGAILLNGAVIEENCLIAAGALVTQTTVVPAGSLVIGSPAVVRRSLREEEILHLQSAAQEYVHAAAEQLDCPQW